jgi:hypothetical protein
MITLLVGLANTAVAGCPDNVAAATTALENVRTEHAAAKREARDTDWEYLSALEDADEVEARQVAALERLRTTRLAVRDAKRALKAAESPTGLVCDPAVPSPTTSS